MIWSQVGDSGVTQWPCPVHQMSPFQTLLIQPASQTFLYSLSSDADTILEMETTQLGALQTNGFRCFSGWLDLLHNGVTMKVMKLTSAWYFMDSEVMSMCAITGNPSSFSLSV